MGASPANHRFLIRQRTPSTPWRSSIRVLRLEFFDFRVLAQLLVQPGAQALVFFSLQSLTQGVLYLGKRPLAGERVARSAGSRCRSCRVAIGRSLVRAAWPAPLSRSRAATCRGRRFCGRPCSRGSHLPKLFLPASQTLRSFWLLWLSARLLLPVLRACFLTSSLALSEGRIEMVWMVKFSL